MWKKKVGEKEADGWYRELECLRPGCNSERHDHLDRKCLKVKKRKYEYGEGYRLEGGRLTPQEKGWWVQHDMKASAERGDTR